MSSDVLTTSYDDASSGAPSSGVPAILPIAGERNILVTSALPYVNNIPHLGNIIGCVLSADTFSRYCKQRGYNTLFVCGTDEYGTATETRARLEGLSPEAICSKYWKIHRRVYAWFDINFDFFGRTSTPLQTEISQSIFRDLHSRNRFLTIRSEQLYCEQCPQFLADRFVVGGCPNCPSTKARGDQCDSCGSLYDSNELKNPKCAICGTSPVIRPSTHLYLDLPGLVPLLESWLPTSVDTVPLWSRIGTSVTKSLVRDGLKPRCITRDLKWGTPVPLDGFEDKVFYVWFDAPIGYISITANYTEEWKSWWLQQEEFQTQYFQFLAKDNIPFHGIIFPATLLGTEQPWTQVTSLQSTHYLNYEGEKFSKSRSVGVFGTDAIESGIESEVWRFYLLRNRPEQQDTNFEWADLAAKVNDELLACLGNYVNRALKFCVDRFDAQIPERSGPLDDELIEGVNQCLADFIVALEAVRIKEGLDIALQLPRMGNAFLQASQFWDLFATDKEKCADVLNQACQLVRLIAAVFQPFIPGLSRKILNQLGLEPNETIPLTDTWDLSLLPAGHKLGEVSPLVKKITSQDVAAFQLKFAGDLAAVTFPLQLVVGHVLAVEDHPANPQLYVLTVNVGEETPRTICAGLKRQFPDASASLGGKRFLFILNLVPRDFGGILSHGMVLAQQKKRNFGLFEMEETVEVGSAVVPLSGKTEPEEAFAPRVLKRVLKKLKVNDQSLVTFEGATLALRNPDVLPLISAFGKGTRVF